MLICTARESWVRLPVRESQTNFLFHCVSKPGSPQLTQRRSLFPLYQATVVASGELIRARGIPSERRPETDTFTNEFEKSPYVYTMPNRNTTSHLAPSRNTACGRGLGVGRQSAHSRFRSEALNGNSHDMATSLGGIDNSVFF